MLLLMFIFMLLFLCIVSSFCCFNIFAVVIPTVVTCCLFLFRSAQNYTSIRWFIDFLYLFHSSKAPTWLSKFAPADALVMQEEAWNAYPRCKSGLFSVFNTMLLQIMWLSRISSKCFTVTHVMDANFNLTRAVIKVKILLISCFIIFWLVFFLHSNISFWFVTYFSACISRGLFLL